MRRTMMLIGLLTILGCGPQAAVKPPAGPPAPAPTAVQPPPVVAPPVTSPATPERVVADTGVGAKGRDYGGGIITEPVRQYFRAPQMIAFDIQIPSGMNTYKALHDNKGPATHEEFMKEIIEAGQIKLPTLPPGERYVYDPATEQLMVERPAKK